MQIPKKIYPCPIAEAIFEIRFESSLPDDAIFGVIYNGFKDDYQEFSKLPILQLPEIIRTKDAALFHKPHYKLQKGNFLIQIGPKVLSLVNLKEYSGWAALAPKISEVFAKLSVTEAVKSVTRIGLRYINVFEGLDIYKNTSLRLFLREKDLGAHQTDLTFEFVKENCSIRVRIANAAMIEVQGAVTQGSVIDIDVVYNKTCEEFFKNISKLASILHDEEKWMFFNLLDDAFLETLNPDY